MKLIKKIFIYLGVLFYFLFFINVFTQLSRIYEIVLPFSEFGAKTLFFVLLIFFAFLALVPIIIFIKLKKPLEIPDVSDEEAYNNYLIKLKERLTKNKYLKRQNFSFDEEKELRLQIEEALNELDKEADKIIKKSSNMIFISTAVSQNGLLDAFFVLTSLSKMVWEIIHLYNQRPMMKEIVNIYVNVAGTVFMAKEVEDLALLENQLEPVLNSIIGGTLGTIFPGMIALTNFVINSVVQGSANAFLSLRIGIMSKKYSGLRTGEDKRLIRKSATLEACAFIGVIIQSNTAFIIKSFAKASKRATIDKTFDTLKKGASKTNNFVRDIFQK